MLVQGARLVVVGTITMDYGFIHGEHPAELHENLLN